MTVHLAELARPSEPGATPSRALTGALDLRRLVDLELRGHDDYVERDPAATMATYADESLREKYLLLAMSQPLPDGAVLGRSGLPLVASDVTGGIDTTVAPVGVLEVFMERHHQQHAVAFDEPYVDPRWRGKGVEERVLAEVERITREHGRTTLMMSASHSLADLTGPGPGAVSDPAGRVHVREDSPTAAFALANGFSLALASRHSVLQLPAAPDVLRALTDQASESAGTYRLIRWTSSTPDAWLDAMAELRSAMSTDIPLGDLDLDAETWTPDLVRHRDANRLIAHDSATTAALDEAHGTLVGFTELVSPRDNPAVAYQGETLVLRGHRGHGLGGWMKAENVAFVQERTPLLRRVHTWNADENSFMLRINDALGFRLSDVEVTWQKTLA